MSRLWWTFAMFLAAQSVDAVVMETGQLAEVVSQVLNVYRPNPRATLEYQPMFSLALSIPYDEEKHQYDVAAVSKVDKPAEVQEALKLCEVYGGTRVMAATVVKWPEAKDKCPNLAVTWPYVKKQCPNVKKWSDFKECPQEKIDELLNDPHKLTEHAEYRVLSELNSVFLKLHEEKNIIKTDLMLFYVLKTPCDKRCTDKRFKFNILQTVENILNWDHAAFVFSHPFKARGSKQTPEQVKSANRKSLKKLGEKLGLENIFRCESSGCFSCRDESGTDNISENCVIETIP